MENSFNVPEKFSSVVSDFAKDLCITFPEHTDKLEKWTKEITKEDEVELYQYCLTVYPKRFFDILYQNDDIFNKEEENTSFFPGLDFALLYNCAGLSENTKKTIWKYLQLILFTVIQDVKDKANFGDSMNMFEGIDEKDLHEKLKETMDGISDFFTKMKDQPKQTDETPFSMPDFDEFRNNFTDMPDMENIQDHLKTLFNGKIGSLAKEMAEEISEEFKDMLGPEAAELNNTEDAMKLFMKDPTKLMGLMKKISTKLDKKMQDGDISREEMMSEASEMLKKMKEMGGGEKMKDMFEKFAKGMGGLGKNMRLDTNAIARMTGMEENRNRIRSKMQQKKDKQLLAIEKMKKERQELLAAQSEALKGCSVEEVTPDNLVFRLEGEESQEKTLIRNADKMAELLLAEEEQENKMKMAPKKKKNKKTK
uniref:Uncharacterized protein n=1 Tax=viral metagenome TaxID=1070528 RepID=A0A6C0B6V0_9ZZZZ